MYFIGCSRTKQKQKMSMLLMQLSDLVQGQIVKRPSKIIKSPYVADVMHGGCEILAHSASLGCCGLSESGATILMELREPKEKTRCAARIYLSVLCEKGQEQIVGIYPKLAEELVESALSKNHLAKLKNMKNYRRETQIKIPGFVDSRFDFTGVDYEGNHFIMEVKNVPLADYEDVNMKQRKGRCYDDYDVNSKIAYFPDGYRKTSNSTISPRALKHIQELTKIKKISKVRCIMCYVMQRTDVAIFQPSVIDPEYRTAFYAAVAAGVEIITLVVQWTKDGNAYFVRDDLPIANNSI
jgi:DNA-binding sugar fermentation-stimulating protein